MLRDVQTYIEKHGIVSIADLSLHFHTDSQTLQPMLNKLSRKGRIRQLPIPEKCAGCTCCNLESLECYEWMNGGKRQPGGKIDGKPGQPLLCQPNNPMNGDGENTSNFAESQQRFGMPLNR